MQGLPIRHIRKKNEGKLLSLLAASKREFGLTDRYRLKRGVPPSGIARNRGEMTHQCCTDTLSLIPIDHGKSDLGLSTFDCNVASASDYRRLTAFVYHRHQGHMMDEVDVQEECDFLFGKVALYAEEAAIETGHRCV